MTYLVLLLAVTGVFVAYVVVRLLEHYSLAHLPTAEIASMYSRRKLYRLTMRAERAKARRKCAALAKISPRLGIKCIVEMFVVFLMIHVFRHIPKRDYRSFVLSIVFGLLVRCFDDVIDGDLEPSEGTRAEAVDHITGIIGGLANSGSLSGPIRSEEVSLFFVIRECTWLLGFDPTEALQRTWMEILPDALRIVAGRTATDQVTLDHAAEANKIICTLGGRFFGLEPDRARHFAELDTVSNLACNNIRGVLKDARAARFNIPLEVFAQYGISLDKLCRASSWEEIAAIPGMAEYYIGETEQHAREWETKLLPALQQDVLPYLRPWIARRIFRSSWNKRTRLFQTYHDWWVRAARNGRVPNT